MPRKRTQLCTWVGPRGSDHLVNCLESPTEDEIFEELTSLPGGDQISCIHLRISKTDWLCVGGSTRENFFLRYQEFSKAGKFESPDGEVPTEIAMKILASYYRGDNYWRTAIKWQRVKIDSQLASIYEEKEIENATSFLAGTVGFLIGLFGGSRK
jgi:hypothetical protein